jgi:uncharacterized alpha-E superfamily protein
MLSRIANSLFWMGRYLERAQHAARYMHVHYYTALDTPLLSRKEFIVDSIISMSGIPIPSTNGDVVTEKEILFTLTMDETNPVSIQNCIYKARENARGARDILSSGVWESINKFYHCVNTFSVEKKMTQEEVLMFTEMVVNNNAIVNGYIHQSLLHNNTWSLIQLGIRIESACQMTRVLLSKINDIQKVKKLNLGKNLEDFQNIALLNSAEAFDMSKIYYKTVPNLRDTLEFLILNREFPRSISFNLNQIYEHLLKIEDRNNETSEAASHYAGKLNASLNFTRITEIEDNIYPFLAKTLGDLYRLADLIEKRIS